MLRIVRDRSSIMSCVLLQHLMADSSIATPAWVHTYYYPGSKVSLLTVASTHVCLASALPELLFLTYYTRLTYPLLAWSILGLLVTM